MSVRPLLLAAAVLAAGYILLLALAYAFQSRLLYFPQREIVATPAAVGLAYEDVRLRTSDGVEIAGWWVPGDSLRAVLFFHGNAGNISGRLPTLRLFHELGFGTLIIDYRGYGNSGGRPTEQGTYRDAEAAWRWLTETQGIPPERIAVFGRSLGGAVAAHATARGFAHHLDFIGRLDGAVVLEMIDDRLRIVGHEGSQRALRLA